MRAAWAAAAVRRAFVTCDTVRRQRFRFNEAALGIACPVCCWQRGGSAELRLWRDLKRASLPGVQTRTSQKRFTKVFGTLAKQTSASQPWLRSTNTVCTHPWVQLTPAGTFIVLCSVCCSSPLPRASTCCLRALNVREGSRGLPLPPPLPPPLPARRPPSPACRHAAAQRDPFGFPSRVQAAI